METRCDDIPLKKGLWWTKDPSLERVLEGVMGEVAEEGFTQGILREGEGTAATRGEAADELGASG